MCSSDLPDYIRNELVECAKMVSALDAKMLTLNEEVLGITKRKE